MSDGLWREIDEAEKSFDELPEWIKRESEPLLRRYQRAIERRRARLESEGEA